MLHLLVAFGMLGGLALGLGLLFLPSLIAKSRNHPNFVPILLVNLFLGWTFIGWVVALAWACTSPAIPVAYAPVYPTVGASGQPYPGPPFSGQPFSGYPAASGYPASSPQVLPPPSPYQGPR